jgi:magnesium-transporting ATPase (P-type)
VVKCSEVLQCSDVLLGFFYRFVYGCMFCVLLFNSVSYVSLLLCLCIPIVMYAVFYILFPSCQLAFSGTLTEVFPCFFLSCKANARVYLAKTGHGPHSS